MKPFDVLISENAISKRVSELAEEINAEFKGKEVVAVCVLKGAFMFMSDVVRHLNFPITLEFLQLTSYHLANSTGEITLVKDVDDEKIAGKNVLVFEDILDTGNSLQFILSHLAKKNPACLKTCVLLDKPERRETESISPDFTGFIIPNKFVIGYGLDYDQKHRNLPYIAYIE